MSFITFSKNEADITLDDRITTHFYLRSSHAQSFSVVIKARGTDAGLQSCALQVR